MFGKKKYTLKFLSYDNSNNWTVLQWSWANEGKPTEIRTLFASGPL